MKKFIVGAVVATALFTPQAFAQSKNFSGFSIAGNVNFANSTSELVAINTPFKASESSSNIGIQGQYTFGFGERFVLGLGATLGLGNLKAGYVNNNTTTLLKTPFSIYVAPGYAVTDTTQIYGKLSSNSAQNEVSNAGGTVNNIVAGLGYGLGVQSFMSKNMFFQAEYTQINYEKVGQVGVLTSQPSSSTLSLGIGYKF